VPLPNFGIEFVSSTSLCIQNIDAKIPVVFEDIRVTEFFHPACYVYLRYPSYQFPFAFAVDNESK
jgi:hypothetical protein